MPLSDSAAPNRLRHPAMPGARRCRALPLRRIKAAVRLGIKGNRMGRRSLCLLLGLLLSGPRCVATKPAASGERPSRPDDINAPFQDPDLDVQVWVDRWESESREIYASRSAIVEALDLRAGMRVADVGAGTGLFLQPFAQAVGEQGRVFAIDIAPAFVRHIEDRARELGLKNVEAILSTPASTELPVASMDVVFVCDTYHHFDAPQAMLRSIHQALRGGGRLVIIDFERIPGRSRDWVINHVRAGKEVFRSEIEQAGFIFRDEVKIDGFRENYLLRFAKR